MTSESEYLLDLARRSLQPYLALPQVEVTSMKQRLNRRRPPCRLPGETQIRRRGMALHFPRSSAPNRQKHSTNRFERSN
jgi:hypothetical protein